MLLKGLAAHTFIEVGVGARPAAVEARPDMDETVPPLRKLGERAVARAVAQENGVDCQFWALTYSLETESTYPE